MKLGWQRVPSIKGATSTHQDRQGPAAPGPEHSKGLRGKGSWRGREQKQRDQRQKDKGGHTGASCQVSTVAVRLRVCPGR